MSTSAPAVPQPAAATSTIPLNRIVAFIGPFVAIIAGALASWLGSHFPGLNLDTTTTAGAIAQAIEFAIGAGVTLALHSKWLEGWQKWEALVAQAASAAEAAAAGTNQSANTASAPTTQRPTLGIPYGQGTPSDG